MDMGNANAISQEANILPPRLGEILSMALDTTPRVKDLGAVPLAGLQPANIGLGGTFFLTLKANVKWWYVLSSSPSATIDETAADAANVTAPTLQATSCVEVQAYEEVGIRVDRLAHRYLVVKAESATVSDGDRFPTTVPAILRGWASSHAGL